MLIVRELGFKLLMGLICINCNIYIHICIHTDTHTTYISTMYNFGILKLVLPPSQRNILSVTLPIKAIVVGRREGTSGHLVDCVLSRIRELGRVTLSQGFPNTSFSGYNRRYIPILELCKECRNRYPVELATTDYKETIHSNAYVRHIWLLHKK